MKRKTDFIVKLNFIVALIVLVLGFCLYGCSKSESKDEISISETNVSLIEGEQFTLSAVYDGDKTLEWSTDEAEIVTVDANGVVTALREGVALITVRAGDAVDTCDVIVTKKNITEDAVLVISTPALSLKVGHTATLTAKAFNMTGTAVFSTEDSEIVNVSEKGVVTALSTGSAKITATLNGLSDTCIVTVTDNIEIILEKPTDFLLCNTSRKLDCGLYRNGEMLDVDLITWTSSDEYVATVKDGVITANNDGVFTVTAFYQGVSRSIDYEVKRTISSVEDFKNITRTGRYILSNDIDFKNEPIPSVAPYTQTKPEGADNSQTLTVNMFEGSIDGNGYALLNVNPWSGITGDTFHSLFGCIGSNGIVKNLSVYARTSTVSGLTAPVAFCNFGLIENVYSELTLYRDGVNDNNQNAGLVTDNRGMVRACISRLKLDSSMEEEKIQYSAVMFGKLIRNCNVDNCFGISSIKDVKLIGQMGNTGSFNIKVVSSELYVNDSALIANAKLIQYDESIWETSFTKIPQLRKNYLNV